MPLILFTPLLAAPDCVSYGSGAAARVDPTDCVEWAVTMDVDAGVNR